MDHTTTSAAVADAPVTSTPESAPSTPTSAPATPAPEKPSSMLDALQKADQQLAGTGDAAPQTAPTTTTGQPATPQGPIPFDVHKTALENARTKATAEALRGLTPDQFNTVVGWWQRAQQDPGSFLTDSLVEHPQAIELAQTLIQRLNTHPTYGPQMKSLAAKALAAARGNSAPQPPAMVKIQLDDGSIVDVPRDPAAFLKFHEAQWEQKVGEKLSPLSQTVESLKAEHEAAVYEAQRDQFVNTTFADVKAWAGVDDAAMKGMAQYLHEAQIDPHDARAISLALHQAYQKVVVPSLGKKAEAAYAASLKTKAAAQIESASTSAAASPLAKPKNPAELARYMASIEAGGR